MLQGGEEKRSLKEWPTQEEENQMHAVGYTIFFLSWPSYLISLDRNLHTNQIKALEITSSKPLVNGSVFVRT